MDDIITIKDLHFQYGSKIVFDHFNLNIKKGSFTTILGTNGSGKTTLMRLLLGLEKCNSYINIGGILVNQSNVKTIRQKIGVVFENPDNQFVAETVMDDIAFSLENLNYDKREIRARIKKVGSYLGIEKIMEKEPHSISGGEKQLVALASALAIEPKILILDEAFTMVDPVYKDQILEILLKLNAIEGLTIINITHDPEESLYGHDILVMDRGLLILKGPKELVLKEDKIFNELGLKLPFMAELSIKLGYYGLVNHIILDMDEMVDTLWG